MLLRDEKIRKRGIKEYAYRRSERNEKVYRYYLQLMKEAGETAKHLSHSFFYYKIAAVFDIKPDTVSRIICSMTREKTFKKFLTDEECDELLNIQLGLNK